MIHFLSRLVISFITLLLVATVCFVLTKIAGEEAAFGERNPTPEVRAEIERKWKLDQPIHVQYFHHMSKLLVLDSMESRQRRNKTLRDILREQLPTSIRLGVRALMLAIMLGVPIGTLCAVYHTRWLDNGGTLVSLVGVSVPSFILASFAIFIFPRIFKSRAIGWETASIPNWVPENIPPLAESIVEEICRFHLWIPAMCLAAFPFAAILRLTRSSVLDALNQDYVRTARAKGVSPIKVIVRHALRNALTPVVTFIGPVTAGVLTGSLVVEKIFNLRGIGSFFVESVSNRDLPIIMGITVFYSFILITMNLIVDAVYPILNPRLRK